MNKLLGVFSFVIALGTVLLTFPDGPAAILLVLTLSAIVLIIINNYTEEKRFLTNIFLGALIARIMFGTIIHVFDLRGFFGGDAGTYDFLGQRIIDIWYGLAPVNDWDSQRAISTNSPGWGMNYITAFIYFILGRNILAAQFLCAVFGAASAPLGYLCAHKIFRNHRVSKITAILIAFFPAFIIWSGQLLKDGIIIFLLLGVMICVITLQKKMKYSIIILLILFILGILSLRFYIFYMIVVSVVGSFIVGQGNDDNKVWQRLVILVILGTSLTYLGGIKTASENFDKFGNLAKVQNSRSDLAKSAESGFGEDIDVSSPQGALLAIPIGFTYLMLAPFPWQMANFRQAITLPEILIWWAMIPLIIRGLWYTIKHKLREAIPILIFTLMLTIAYSIFQGNVGTAYRQRTQIQVFLFIFIAVGWSLMQEKKENSRLIRQEKQKQREQALRDRRNIISSPTVVK